LGGPVLLALLALASLGAFAEFARLLGLSLPAGAVLGLPVVLPYYLNLYYSWIPWQAYFIAYLLLWASVYFVFFFQKLSFQQSAGLIFAGLYVPVLASTLFLVRMMEAGFILTLAILLVTWGTDTAALFAGQLWGKGKLAPAISPNKSWAGAWGGLIAGIIIAGAFGILVDGNLFLFALWGALASVLGQIGDLCESAFKRFAGVKDSGRILPGHGGFLDRIDSLLFTAASSYIYFILVLLP
jgi:phosphatidate cytidylyltransferase